MNLQEALETAITFEVHIRDHYALAAARTADSTGRRVFETLAREEQGHVDYLASRLEEWKRDGRIQPVALETLLPPKEWVEQQAVRLAQEARASSLPATPEATFLKEALEMERQASAHYQELFSKLPVQDRDLFHRFMQIEDGHVLVVQAELDALAGHGHWFDFMEFRLENS